MSVLNHGQTFGISCICFSSGKPICCFNSFNSPLSDTVSDLNSSESTLPACELFTTSAPIPVEKRPVTFQFAGAQSVEGKKPGPKWYHVLR